MEATRPPAPGLGSPFGDVVVAVDSSAGSRTALRWAAAAAEDIGARLRVVQSWEYPASVLLPWATDAPPSPETIDEDVRRELAAVVAGELGEDVPAEIQALRGPPATALLNLVADIHPRMLVVGSRGLGGFRGLVLGSVSRHCLEYATCPVVVVPSTDGTIADAGLSSIVVGTDPSPDSQLALTYAMQLAGKAGAAVASVHALAPELRNGPPAAVDELRAAIDRWLAGQRDRCAVDGVPFEQLVVEGEPREVLAEMAVERAANLLVVGAVGEGTLPKELGPVASHLGSHAPVPVAVVRTPAPPPRTQVVA